MENTVVPNPGASAAPEVSHEGSLLRDLALILSEDKAAYLRLGPEGAVLAVKSPETIAFGETVDCN